MNKLTIVIADDEPIALKSGELLIRKEFPNLEIAGLAGDGIEFKNMVEKLKPDIAIVDINMPGLSGLEAMELLKRRGSRTHFLIHSAYSNVEYLKAALDLHTDGYIVKPGKRDEVIETISKMCRLVEREKEAGRMQEEVKTVLQVVNPFFGSEILMSILSEKTDQENFDAYCRMNHIQFSGGCIITYLPEKGTLQDRKKILLGISEILADICSHLTTVNDHELIVMLFLPAEIEPTKQKTWCGEIAEILADGIEKLTLKPFLYGIGSIYDTFARMKDSYQESTDLFSSDPASDAFFNDSADKLDDYAMQAKDYIRHHYTKDISLNDCANRIGICPYYLSRVFKDRTGMNFVEYLSAVRMEAAKSLCEDESLSIREIAEKSGYANITYFYRVFKKAVGLTVGEYRKERLTKKRK